jgi:hypothetical protein
VPEVTRQFNFDQAETIVADLATTNATRPAVAPVCYRKQGTEVSIEGTAFCIGLSPTTGEALFVTASHTVDVLDPDRVEGVSQPETGIEPFVLLPKKDVPVRKTEDLYGVRILQFVRNLTYSDIALLVVDISDGEHGPYDVKQLAVSFARPVVGQKTMALGYPQIPGFMQTSLVASRGRIDELHPNKRDSSFVTYPSFRTTGNYLPGMSGGPIFNNGIPGDPAGPARVIGVVSSGYQSDPPIGYGASIGGILEMKPDLHTDDGVLQQFTMPDLISGGYIVHDGSDVTLSRKEDGVYLTWTED